MTHPVITTRLNEKGELPAEVLAIPAEHAREEVTITIHPARHNPFDEFIGIIPPVSGGAVAFVRNLRYGDEED